MTDRTSKDVVLRLIQAAESVIENERSRTPDESWWTAPYRRLAKAVADAKPAEEPDCRCPGPLRAPFCPVHGASEKASTSCACGSNTDTHAIWCTVGQPLKTAAPSCIWRTGCKHPDTCKTAECCVPGEPEKASFEPAPEDPQSSVDRWNRLSTQPGVLAVCETCGRPGEEHQPPKYECPNVCRRHGTKGCTHPLCTGMDD